MLEVKKILQTNGDQSDFWQAQQELAKPVSHVGVDLSAVLKQGCVDSLLTLLYVANLLKAYVCS